MSYSVRLDDEVERKIVGWRLPNEGMTAILRRLNELREMPSRKLLRIESSRHPLQTDVFFRDPGPPPRDCLVVLYVRYGMNEETLYIVDGDWLFDDQPA